MGCWQDLFEMNRITVILLHEAPVDVEDIYQMLRYWAFVQGIVVGLRNIVGDWETLKSLLITPSQAREWYRQLPNYGAVDAQVFGDFLREFNPLPEDLGLLEEEDGWPLPTPPYSPLLRAIEYEPQAVLPTLSTLT